jgi:hypothetical protein
MLKKVAVIAGALLALLLTLIIGLSIYAARLIDADFIVAQLESSLNCRAELKELDAGLFSAVSSVRLGGLALGPRDDYANRGVPQKDRPPLARPLVSAKEVRLALKFWPLLSRHLVVREFVLVEPTVNLAVYANGSNSLAPLFSTPRIVNGEPNPALAEKPAAPEAPAANTGPFTARDLPIAGSLGRIAIERGTLNLALPDNRNRALVAPIDLSLSDIEIDPEDLQNKNQARLVFNAQAKLFDRANREAALLKLASNGVITPFDAATGRVNPRLKYAIQVSEGSYVNGLALLNQLSGNLPALARAGVKMEDLAKKAELTKNVEVSIEYGRALIKLLNAPVFPTRHYDFSLTEGSSLSLGDNQHRFTGRVFASAEETERVFAKVDAEIARAIKGDETQARELRNKVFAAIVKEDRVFLDFISSGDLSDPAVELLANLPSLADLVKEAGGELVRSRVQNELGRELDKRIGPGGGAVKDQIQKGVEGLFR